jgi:hypothetical protein
VWYISPAGDGNIGRILTVSQHTVTIQRRLPDPAYDMDSIFLPSCYVKSAEHQVIPMPSLLSSVHMVKASDLSDFKVRFPYGMTNIICTRRQDFFFQHVQESLMFIIVDFLSQISIELQRVLCNRRKNQQCLSSISLQLSELT